VNFLTSPTTTQIYPLSLHDALPISKAPIPATTRINNRDWNLLSSFKKAPKIIFVIHEAKSIIKVRIKISNVLRQTKLGLKRATSWILFKIKVQDTANPIIVANKGPYTSN